MKPYPCIESTIDIMVGEDRNVRLWIDRDDVPTILPAMRVEVQEIRQAFVTLKAPEFFAWLKEYIPRLSAAQVQRLDPQSPTRTFLGTVVYYVSFTDDPHG